MRKIIIFYKYVTALLVLVVYLSGCTTLQAIKLVNSGEVASDNISKSVIPFELNGHPIFIKVRLNNSEHEYKFVLDTGALTVISQKVAKEQGLQDGIEVEAHGSSGKTKKVNLVQLKNVIVGNSEVQNLAAAVIDLSGIIGADVDGIIGSNFLKFFQVTIDYQENTIILDQDAQPVPVKSGDIQIAFETDMKMGFAPIVECKINGDIKCEAMIDTGTPELASLSLSLIKQTDSFQEGNLLKAKGSMSSGIGGNVDESYMLRLNTLEIGYLKIDDIPTTSHSLTLRDEGLLLGNAFLSKFLVTIDYPAKNLVLQPYDNTLFETNIFSYGLNIILKDKKIIVSGIWDKSSAFKSGLGVGDEIVKVNSIDISMLSISELMKLYLDKKTESIDISFIHDNHQKDATLHKEMLLPPIKK